MNKIIKDEIDKLKGCLNTLLTERNIEGFIFSWFHKYDWVNDKYVLNTLIKKPITGVYRDSKLFLVERKEIILSVEEIEFINGGFFEKKVEQLFENIDGRLDKFHKTNKLNFKSEIIKFYEEIESNIADNFYNAYNQGTVKNFEKINVHNFRVLLRSRQAQFNETLKELKNTLQNHVIANEIDNNWKNVFKNEEDYKILKQIRDGDEIVNAYLDYSYIFHQLKDKMYDLKHEFFMNWLFENKFIKESELVKFRDKRSFEINSKSDFRINLYLRYYK